MQPAIPRAAERIFLYDKPVGPSSHSVVAQMRRHLGIKRVGHAGTLDPGASGLLLLGSGRATRLLTFFVGLDKSYRATVVLGERSSTDDAQGEIVFRAPPAALKALTREQVREEMRRLTGEIMQRPSTYSAIKVDGKRAYDLARQGKPVKLKSRPVTVSRFELLEYSRSESQLRLEVLVECSSGTYIRALARDLGAALQVGGRLDALRRHRIGPFQLPENSAGLPESPSLSAAEAATAVLPELPVNDEESLSLAQGKPLRRELSPGSHCSGPWAATREERGSKLLVAVVDLMVEAGEHVVRSRVVFTPSDPGSPPSGHSPPDQNLPGI